MSRDAVTWGMMGKSLKLQRCLSILTLKWKLCHWTSMRLTVSEWKPGRTKLCVCCGVDVLLV